MTRKLITTVFTIVCLANVLYAQGNASLPTQAIGGANGPVLSNYGGLGGNNPALARFLSDLVAQSNNLTGPGAAQALGDRLPAIVQNVDLTQGDTMQNVTLPDGLRQDGTISGGTATSIIAIKDDGSVFTGTINPSTGHYIIIESAGNYNDLLCYGPTTPFSTTILTFNDGPIVVAGDMTRDEMLPGPTTSNVTGMVNGRDPATIGVVVLASQDGTTGGSGVVLPFQTNYSLSVPDGNYTAGYFQISFTGATSRYVVGNVMVNGPTQQDFSVPPSANVFGMVNSTMMAPQIPLPDFWYAFLDALGGRTAAPVAPTCTGAPGSGGNVQGDMSGTYSLAVANGIDYSLSFLFQLLPSQPPQTPGSLIHRDPVTVSVQGDTQRDESIPAPPGTASISGQVTGASGDPVPNATVGAFATQVTGNPNAYFSRSTTTDSNGIYTLTGLSGIYTVAVIPAPPTP